MNHVTHKYGTSCINQRYTCGIQTDSKLPQQKEQRNIYMVNNNIASKQVTEEGVFTC
jgi:hypothetical protein